MEAINKEATEYTPLISVIIPVYGSEETLEKCVKSALSQEYEKLEILLLPNGGRKEDAQLCEKLAGEDARIRVICPAENGASQARNEGIKKAQGSLLLFLDSDDQLLPGAVSSMLEQMRQDKSDLVIGGFDHLYFGKRVVKPVHKDGCIDPILDREDMQKLYEQGFLNMPWNKLYKKELIRELFPEDLSLGEDLCFNLDYIRQCQRLSLHSGSVYEYLQDDRGSTLSGKKRDDKVRVCLQLRVKAKRFFMDIWQVESTDKVLGFLDDKVVSTFLDELGLIGVADLPNREFAGQVRHYTEAIRRFTCEGAKPIRLSYADHKILYGPASKGKAKTVARLIKMRGKVVKLKRRIDRDKELKHEENPGGNA